MLSVNTVCGWIKRLPGWRLAVVGALLIILIAGRLVSPTVVEVEIDGRTQVLRTRAATVSQALSQAGIRIKPGDQVVPSPEAKPRQGMKIEVNRGVPVTFLVAGKPVEVTVSSSEARALFGDAVTGPTTVLKLTRVITRALIEDLIIPYQEERQVDYRLPMGTVKTVQTGRFGLTRRVTLVTVEEGKKPERQVVDSTVLTQPRNKVVVVGGQAIVQGGISRGEIGNFRPRAELMMEATAYTHTGNRTASGIYPYVGVVAVDPRVIPLGTKLFVEGYGPALAADTGGLIKGGIIDVFLNTAEECIKWGRRTVKVYLLE